MHSKIDNTLNGFIDQLFSQRRRSILSGLRGGAIVSDPNSVDAILRAPDQFKKAYGLLQALGRNRFSTDGAEWEWRRALTQRDYLRAGLVENKEKVADAYQRRLAECENTKPATITRALLAASTELFHDAFGCTVAIEPMLSFLERARELLKRLQYFSLIPPSPSERSVLERDAQLIIQCYLAEIERSPSLKALMGRLQAEAEAEADNFIAAEEFMMNFFAAVETTTATLSFAIDRLGAYHAAEDALAAEVIAEQTFPQLECFINETLRYYPPIPILVRYLASDARVENLQLKAGSVIVISVIGVHHHPGYWHNPDLFDCARAEFVENTYDRRAFIPFSSGIRSCGGAKLARLELAEGLKAFIRRFIVTRKSDELSFDYAIAMRPKSWDCVEIARR